MVHDRHGRSGRCERSAGVFVGSHACECAVYHQVNALLLALVMQTPNPPVAIPRVDTTIQIDGVLDEPVWQQAARLTDFHQYEPVDGRPAAERTEVLIWYAPDAIHFGI